MEVIMSQQTQPQLKMVKPSIEELPELSVPSGYTIRHYREGDAYHWDHIINESFRHDFNFEKFMRGKPAFMPERIFFLCHQDIPVATASAWHRPEIGPKAGSLHMVGILKSHSGHGLGYFICLAALYQMKNEGRTRAVLSTDDFRIPAIKTYLKLGFVPILTHESHEQRWNIILKKIGRDDLLSAPLLRIEDYNPYAET